MKTHAFLLCVIFFLGGLFAPKVEAVSSKFSVYYSLDYQFQDSGLATVKLKTTLTNLTSDYIANKTTINVGKINIQNSNAFDNQGLLKLITKSTETNSQLIVELPNAASGKNSQYSYSVSYQTPDLLSKQGNLYQITIPNPSQNDLQVTDFRIHVTVPKSFGKATIVRPYSEDLVFTKETLGSTNVFLTFNPSSVFQTYVVNLKYHLENRNTSAEFVQIPVPASNAYQNFYWTKSLPRPTDATIDDKGNWWAKYYLGPKAVQEVAISGTVQSFDRPILDSFVTVAGPVPTDNPLSLKLAGVWEIYNFIIKNYHYLPAANSHRSSQELLNSPGVASCEEISQLFQDLGQNIGIRVEPVLGLVFPNENSFHCWLTYLDPATGKMIAVDPSLEQGLNSQGYFSQWDLTHIFFLTGKEKKLLSAVTSFEAKPTVEFDEAALGPNLTLRADFPRNFISGQPYEGKVIITNSGPDQTGPIDLYITAKRLKTDRPIVHFANLPPYATRQMPITLSGISWTDSGDDIISLKLEDKVSFYPVTFQPFFISEILISLVLICCAFTVFKFTKIPRRLHFPRWER